MSMVIARLGTNRSFTSRVWLKRVTFWSGTDISNRFPPLIQWARVGPTMKRALGVLMLQRHVNELVVTG